MEERILKFIAALRGAGVRISLAESADAFRALEYLGIKNRDSFHTSLRTTLVKDAASLPVFEELFPIFFGGSGQAPMMNLAEDLTPDEARQLAEALRQYKDALQKLLQRLVDGRPLSKEELDRLGRMVGLSHAEDMRSREWMTQRMLRALQFREVQQALKELAEMLAQSGMDRERIDQLRQFFLANQRSLEDQVRQYVGERIAENMSERPSEDSLDSLYNRPFEALSDRDMDRLRKEVKRLAASLRTRIALRQKRAHSGQLDAKSTIRANLKHASVPVEIRHKDHTLKPKLVVICDISTSMRSCSELMLSLIYALQDLVTRTHAFAFIDHLEYISPDFETRDPAQAVQQVLQRLPSGYYNTDLGNSLNDLRQRYLDTIDSRTTCIIVGDGRNNYNDPQVEVLSMLARRSRRLIWLNPEPPILWGSGDSDMLKYAPICSTILQAATLAQLSTAIDRLMQ